MPGVASVLRSEKARIRSVDVQGAGRTHWNLETRRSALPDPHPSCLSAARCGDPALETPHSLQGLLALSALALVLGPTLGIESDLGDGPGPLLKMKHEAKGT